MRYFCARFFVLSLLATQLMANGDGYQVCGEYASWCKSAHEQSKVHGRTVGLGIAGLAAGTFGIFPVGILTVVAVGVDVAYAPNKEVAISNYVAAPFAFIPAYFWTLRVYNQVAAARTDVTTAEQRETAANTASDSAQASVQRQVSAATAELQRQIETQQLKSQLELLQVQHKLELAIAQAAAAAAAADSGK
ncbi:MAG: hypothetical protein JKY15_00295 [Deltaproteobacteria bacterium]|nr:hypothetical protein [Deltaproteobacteria bacterium]